MLNEENIPFSVASVSKKLHGNSIGLPPVTTSINKVVDVVLVNKQPELTDNVLKCQNMS